MAKEFQRLPSDCPVCSGIVVLLTEGKERMDRLEGLLLRLLFFVLVSMGGMIVQLILTVIEVLERPK